MVGNKIESLRTDSHVRGGLVVGTSFSLLIPLLEWGINRIWHRGGEDECHYVDFVYNDRRIHPVWRIYVHGRVRFEVSLFPLNAGKINQSSDRK